MKAGTLCRTTTVWSQKIEKKGSRGHIVVVRRPVACRTQHYPMLNGKLYPREMRNRSLLLLYPAATASLSEHLDPEDRSSSSRYKLLEPEEVMPTSCDE
ncbi:unnamed protein product [Heligmosomoides polygyrus]|uniref:Uncharacterized protein n=1 Tax=Heligmosomoides polygyrus TaxID=6339 RepID=A0A183GAC6_HELPZ|nr:unnamed protein product [Heligmosomoides polygyrus]